MNVDLTFSTWNHNRSCKGRDYYGWSLANYELATVVFRSPHRLQKKPECCCCCKNKQIWIRPASTLAATRCGIEFTGYTPVQSLNNSMIALWSRFQVPAELKLGGKSSSKLEEASLPDLYMIYVVCMILTGFWHLLYGKGNPNQA